MQQSLYQNITLSHTDRGNAQRQAGVSQRSLLSVVLVLPVGSSSHFCCALVVYLFGMLSSSSWQVPIFVRVEVVLDI
eukprot:286742-Amphidinium_carterae.1